LGWKGLPFGGSAVSLHSPFDAILSAVPTTRTEFGYRFPGSCVGKQGCQRRDIIAAKVVF
jgi:hypothetical protein